MNVLAQILGALAIICWVISIQQKNKQNILVCQIVANGLYAIQYYLLGALTAASMNFTSFLRSIVFYDNEKKNRKHSKFSLLFFSSAIIIFGALTYNGLFNLIPIVITLAYTYSVWQNNLFIARLVFLTAAFIWIYYNIKVGAYISIIGNVLEIISGITALIRFKNK